MSSSSQVLYLGLDVKVQIQVSAPESGVGFWLRSSVFLEPARRVRYMCKSMRLPRKLVEQFLWFFTSHALVFSQRPVVPLCLFIMEDTLFLRFRWNILLRSSQFGARFVRYTLKLGFGVRNQNSRSLRGSPEKGFDITETLWCRFQDQALTTISGVRSLNESQELSFDVRTWDHVPTLESKVMSRRENQGQVPKTKSEVRSSNQILEFSFDAGIRSRSESLQH